MSDTSRLQVILEARNLTQSAFQQMERDVRNLGVQIERLGLTSNRAGDLIARIQGSVSGLRSPREIQQLVESLEALNVEFVRVQNAAQAVGRTNVGTAAARSAEQATQALRGQEQQLQRVAAAQQAALTAARGFLSGQQLTFSVTDRTPQQLEQIRARFQAFGSELEQIQQRVTTAGQQITTFRAQPLPEPVSGRQVLPLASTLQSAGVSNVRVQPLPAPDTSAVERAYARIEAAANSTSNEQQRAAVRAAAAAEATPERAAQAAERAAQREIRAAQQAAQQAEQLAARVSATIEALQAGRVVTFEIRDRTPQQLAQLEQNVKTAGAQLEQLGERITQTGQRISTVRLTPQVGGGGGLTTLNIAALAGELEAFNIAAVRSTADVEGRMDHLGRTISGVVQGLGHASGVIQSFGAGVGIAAGTAAIASGLIQVTRSTADFEREVRGTNALLNQTGVVAEASFRRMEAEVRQAGVALGIGATQSAKALYETISSGIPIGQQAFEVLSVGSKAAVGGLTETQTAVDGITSALNAYHLSASDAMRVSDEMFQAVNIGKLTFDEFARSIGIVAPVAAAMGVSLGEVGGLIANATQQGARASIAFEGMRSALNAFLRPSKEAKDLATQLGVEFDAEAVRTKGFSTALNDVVQAAGGNEEVLGRMLGDVQAITFALANTGPNAGSAARAIDQVGNSAGATANAAAQVEQSGARAFERFGARAEEVGLKLGTLILPPLTKVLEQVTQLGNVLGAWPVAPPPQSQVDRFVGLGAAAQQAQGQVSGLSGALSGLDRAARGVEVGVVANAAEAALDRLQRRRPLVPADQQQEIDQQTARIQAFLRALRSASEDTSTPQTVGQALEAVRQFDPSQLLTTSERLKQAWASGQITLDQYLQKLQQLNEAEALIAREQERGADMTLDTALARVQLAHATQEQTAADREAAQAVQERLQAITSAQDALKQLQSSQQQEPGRLEQRALQALRDTLSEQERLAQRQSETSRNALEATADQLQQQAEQGRNALEDLRAASQDARGELEALSRVRVQGTQTQENRVFDLGTRAAADQLQIEQAKLARLQARVAGQAPPDIDREALRAAARDALVANQEAQVAQLQGRVTIEPVQRRADQTVNPVSELPPDELIAQAQAAREGVTAVEGPDRAAFDARLRQMQREVQAQEREAQAKRREAQLQAQADQQRLQQLRDHNADLLQQAQQLAQEAEDARQEAERQALLAKIAAGQQAAIEQHNPEVAGQLVAPETPANAAGDIAALAGQAGTSLSVPGLNRPPAPPGLLSAEDARAAAQKQVDAAATQDTAAANQKYAAELNKQTAEEEAHRREVARGEAPGRQPGETVPGATGEPPVVYVPQTASPSAPSAPAVPANAAGQPTLPAGLPTGAGAGLLPSGAEAGGVRTPVVPTAPPQLPPGLPTAGQLAPGITQPSETQPTETPPQLPPDWMERLRPQAMGGPAQKDAPYLVGERGPELFVPREAGTIIPAHVTQELMRAQHRAEGGPVTPGSSYIVGEQGPEVAVIIPNTPVSNIAGDIGSQMGAVLRAIGAARPDFTDQQRRHVAFATGNLPSEQYVQDAVNELHAGGNDDEVVARLYRRGYRPENPERDRVWQQLQGDVGQVPPPAPGSTVSPPPLSAVTYTADDVRALREQLDFKRSLGMPIADWELGELQVAEEQVNARAAASAETAGTAVPVLRGGTQAFTGGLSGDLSGQLLAPGQAQGSGVAGMLPGLLTPQIPVGGGATAILPGLLTPGQPTSQVAARGVTTDQGSPVPTANALLDQLITTDQGTQIQARDLLPDLLTAKASAGAVDPLVLLPQGIPDDIRSALLQATEEIFSDPQLKDSYLQGLRGIVPNPAQNMQTQGGLTGEVLGEYKPLGPGTGAIRIDNIAGRPPEELQATAAHELAHHIGNVLKPAGRRTLVPSGYYNAILSDMDRADRQMTNTGIAAPHEGWMSEYVNQVALSGAPTAVDEDWAEFFRQWVTGDKAQLARQYPARTKVLREALKQLEQRGQAATGTASPAAGAAAAAAQAGLPSTSYPLISVEQAQQLPGSVQLPSEEEQQRLQKEAMKWSGTSMPLEFTPEGVRIDLERLQNPERAGHPSISGGVFYAPTGQLADTGLDYSVNELGREGGTQHIRGTTLLRRPLFLQGNNLEDAYEELIPPEVLQSLSSDAPDPNQNPEPWLAAMRTAGDPAPEQGLAEALRYQNVPGNAGSTGQQKVSFILRDRAAIARARQQGYDSIVMMGEGFAVSEVIDLREQNYPAAGSYGDLGSQPPESIAPKIQERWWETPLSQESAPISLNESALPNMLTARQEGGPVAPPEQYLVGEAGPELFTPTPSPTATPTPSPTAISSATLRQLPPALPPEATPAARPERAHVARPGVLPQNDPDRSLFVVLPEAIGRALTALGGPGVGLGESFQEYSERERQAMEIVYNDPRLLRRLGAELDAALQTISFPPELLITDPAVRMGGLSKEPIGRVGGVDLPSSENIAKLVLGMALGHYAGGFKKAVEFGEEPLLAAGEGAIRGVARAGIAAGRELVSDVPQELQAFRNALVYEAEAGSLKPEQQQLLQSVERAIKNMEEEDARLAEGATKYAKQGLTLGAGGLMAIGKRAVRNAFGIGVEESAAPAESSPDATFLQSDLFGGTITPRAAGGPAEQQRMYLVGERGPELFLPKERGMILPNHELRRLHQQRQQAQGAVDAWSWGAMEGRQGGGPVDPTRRYRVGELGPELYLPGPSTALFGAAPQLRPLPRLAPGAVSAGGTATVTANVASGAVVVNGVQDAVKSRELQSILEEVLREFSATLLDTDAPARGSLQGSRRR